MRLEIRKGGPPTRADDWLFAFVLALWLAVTSWMVNGCGRFDGCPSVSVEVFQSPPTPIFKPQPPAAPAHP